MEFEVCIMIRKARRIYCKNSQDQMYALLHIRGGECHDIRSDIRVSVLVFNKIVDLCHSVERHKI